MKSSPTNSDVTNSNPASGRPETVGTPHHGARRLHPSDPVWIDWMKQLQQDGTYSFFKVDVTFRSSAAGCREQHWLEYFNDRVLYKIRKMVRGKVFDQVREYEHGEKYKARDNPDGRYPHHIHSIVGVPPARAGRMLSARLKKDINSLPEVSSCHIEPIPADSTDPHKTLEAAFAYMRKRKTFRPMT
jgi:hypothetical protein